MSERYIRVFSLEENLYSAETPVLISAGGLTKDNQTGKVFAQLRLQNIDRNYRNIVALKVAITTYDPAGNVLEASREYQYLDLNVGRGNEFGSKQAISLDNSSARSFDVTVLEAVFSEGTPWTANKQDWVSLGRQKTLEEALGTELEEQYRRDTFSDAKYEIFANHGAWMCACGALNIAGENSCCRCGNKEIELVKALDHSALANHLKKHTAEVNKQIQEKANKKKRTVKKITLILLPFILIGLFFGVKSYVEKQREEAALLEAARIAAEKETNLKNLLCSDTWVELKDGEAKILLSFFRDGTGNFTNTPRSGDITWEMVDEDTVTVYGSVFVNTSVFTWDIVQENGKYSFTNGSLHTLYRQCDLD